MAFLSRAAGIVLLLGGIGWAVWIVGGVLSHDPALDTVAELIGPLAFHTVSMVLGAFLLAAGLARKAKAREATAVPAP